MVSTFFSTKYLGFKGHPNVRYRAIRLSQQICPVTALVFVGWVVNHLAGLYSTYVLSSAITLFSFC